jgi:hypothetical protein
LLALFEMMSKITLDTEIASIIASAKCIPGKMSLGAIQQRMPAVSKALQTFLETITSSSA